MPISNITSELVNKLIQARGQIKNLNLSDNCLSVIENLDALTQLQNLDLSRNKITGEARSTRCLASLRSLVELDLSNNEIQELKYIGTALGPLVKHLHLKNNRIENLEQLQYLGGLHCLETLELEGNTVVKEEGYRECIARTLPWLQELDGESLRPSGAAVSAESSIYQDQTRSVVEEEEKEELPVLNSQCVAEGALSLTENNHGHGDGRLCMKPGLLPISTNPPTDSAAAESEEMVSEILSAAISLAVDSTARSVMSTGLPGSCSSDDDYLLDSQEQRRKKSLEKDRETPPSLVTVREKCSIPMPPNPWRNVSSRHHPFLQEPVDEMLGHASTITPSSSVYMNDFVPEATAGLLKNTPNGKIHPQQLHPMPPPWFPSSQPPQNSAMNLTDSLQSLPGTLPTRPPSREMKSKAISPLERSRQMSVYSSHIQSSQNIVDTTACDDKNMKISSLTREIEFLSAQNKALRKAISSQNEALVVRHRGSSRNSSHYHNSPGDIPLSENVSDRNIISDTEDDPYVQLLNCWRREVLQLLTEKEINQVEQRKYYSEIEESTMKSNLRCMELEKLLLAAESKVDASEAELALLKDRTNTLSMELSRSQSRCSTFETECARRRDLEGKMLQGLFSFQENVNSKYYDNTKGLMSALSRLKGFESRLSHMCHRVQLVTALQKQKEVHLRNCRAAFEADKRVWYLERERREVAALAEAGAASSSSTMTEAHPSGSSSFWRPNGFVCGLQPECEAAMRTVFCNLDKQGAGKVEWEGLLQALRDNLGVMALMTSILGKQKWRAALASIESQLVESQVQQLSWGEFLLFFIPMSNHRRYSVGNPLSSYHSNFWSNSRTPGWREINESLPMLQLMVPLANKTAATLPTMDDLTTQELRKEVRRLCKERTFLMETLREESTAFMQRSEDVYDLFRNELRVAYGNVETSKAKAEAARDELSVELKRVSDLQYTLKKEKANRTESEDSWKRRFELSSATQESSLKVAEKEFQKRVDTEKERSMCLNEDISLLRQELAKGNVAKQSLEHQLSCDKKFAEDALRDVKEDLCGRLTARDRELAAVRRERNSLLAIVRDQQQKGLLKFGATGEIAQSGISSSRSLEVFSSTGRNHTKELVQHAEAASAIAGILLEGSSNDNDE